MSVQCYQLFGGNSTKKSTHFFKRIVYLFLLLNKFFTIQTTARHAVYHVDDMLGEECMCLMFFDVHAHCGTM